MTTALCRRLDSLRRLADRPGTAAEGIAAEAAIERLLRRLGEDRERLTEREPPYVQPTRQQRSRRRTAAERAHQEKMHVGDIIDLHLWCRCGRGHGRFEVLSAIELGHYGMLRCCGALAVAGMAGG
jgi:hypothetical protein